MHHRTREYLKVEQDVIIDHLCEYVHPRKRKADFISPTQTTRTVEQNAANSSHESDPAYTAKATSNDEMENNQSESDHKSLRNSIELDETIVNRHKTMDGAEHMSNLFMRIAKSKYAKLKAKSDLGSSLIRKLSRKKFITSSLG